MYVLSTNVKILGAKGYMYDCNALVCHNLVVVYTYTISTNVRLPLSRSATRPPVSTVTISTNNKSRIKTIPTVARKYVKILLQTPFVPSSRSNMKTSRQETLIEKRSYLGVQPNPCIIAIKQKRKRYRYPEYISPQTTIQKRSRQKKLFGTHDPRNSSNKQKKNRTQHP